MDTLKTAVKSQSSVSSQTQQRPHWSSNPFFSFGLFFLVIFVDQSSKFFAAGAGADVLINHGISFGLFSNTALVLVLCTALVVLFFALRKRVSPLILALFFSAAVSNVLDRLVFGGVRDWLTVPVLGLHNNIADWVLFTAVLAAVVQFAHGERPKTQG